MWINTCWCTLNSIPIWHARGIYQKETTSSKHFYKAEWIPYLAANWSLQNYNKGIDVRTYISIMQIISCISYGVYHFKKQNVITIPKELY